MAAVFSSLLRKYFKTDSENSVTDELLAYSKCGCENKYPMIFTGVDDNIAIGKSPCLSSNSFAVIIILPSSQTFLHSVMMTRTFLLEHQHRMPFEE